ncbi:MAG: porphobilinogen synthase [Magnetococcales bacterium]|nr:porphobilinogen synthase [Magnetococcales bacterium]MBF0156329.1 porphobilinogen synthase [Magnetococcales bacterium]
MVITHRPRRLREDPRLRRMVRENGFTPRNLVLPLFIVPGEGVERPVSAMPGVSQLSADRALPLARRAQESGLGGVILFGIPPHKDAEGSASWSENGVVQNATRKIREAVPDLYVIADLCLCEYTDHAHCGVLRQGRVDNDATLERLGRQAISLAEAGVDMLAPSGMMDGMVGYLRDHLDQAGRTDLPILSYAVKYASAYYGPFREAAENTPSSGDRQGYQMDPANRREALKEAALDEAQGADMLMVKPGLPYLDILRELRDRTNLPLAVYNVSGEYAMVKAAAAQGWIDERRVVLETLTAFRRAGADLILTYHALDAVGFLR